MSAARVDHRDVDQHLPRAGTSGPGAGARGAPASRWPWPVQALLCPAVLFAAIFSQAVLALLPGIERVDDPAAPTAVVLAVVVGGNALTLAVAVVGVALLARLDGRRRLRDVGWCVDRRSLPALALGLAVGAVVLLGVGLPLTAVGVLRPMDAGIDGVPLVLVLGVGLSQALLLQAVPEELIFRGYLLGSLRLAPVPAVLVSGLVFGALHLASSGGQQGWGERVAYLAMPTGFGLAAGALVLLTRSLWVAIGVHGGFHLAVLGLVVAERAGSPLFLGDGPALWLTSGLAWTVVAALVTVVVVVRRGTTSSRDTRGSRAPV